MCHSLKKKMRHSQTMFSFQVVKILNAADEHVMALGANFSLQADSHLVCIQNEQGYKTQAINIQNQARKGTTRLVVWFLWNLLLCELELSTLLETK